MKNRGNKILELLTKDNKIEVSHLAEELGVSQVTMRKDLDTLESKGVIKREHGFALLVAAQHHIVGYVHVSDKTHAESVLGDERKSYSEVAYLERRFVAQIVNAACFRIVVKDLAAFK